MEAMCNLQAMLFLLLFVGAISRKLGIITAEGRKCLSGMVIKIILPFNILKSFCITWSYEILSKVIVVLAVAIIFQIMYVILSKILYRGIESDKRAILQYGTICSNAGFMGNPIVEAIYDSEGLLYTSIALIPLRVAMWSSGLSLFTKADKKTMVKKVALHPCMISVYIGFVIMLLQLKLPNFLMNCVTSIANCNTAVSMLVIGAILVDMNWRDIFDPYLFYYSGIRLIVIPLIVFGIMKLIGIDSMVTGVTVLLSAMPAGSTTVLLADTYGKNSKYASACVFLSTVLSLITLPLISTILFW